LTNLKTNHLLNASTSTYFYARIVGGLVSTFMSFSIYVLFTEAYPCINDNFITICGFPAPDVGAWRAIAFATPSPTIPVLQSSGYIAVGLRIFAIVLTVVKNRFIYARSMCSFIRSSLGIAFILNTTNHPQAIA
jgi:hypothetical protein